MRRVDAIGAAMPAHSTGHEEATRLLDVPGGNGYPPQVTSTARGCSVSPTGAPSGLLLQPSSGTRCAHPAARAVRPREPAPGPFFPDCANAALLRPGQPESTVSAHNSAKRYTNVPVPVHPHAVKFLTTIQIRNHISSHPDCVLFINGLSNLMPSWHPFCIDKGSAGYAPVELNHTP